jgi:hypothetical protein
MNDPHIEHIFRPNNTNRLTIRRSPGSHLQFITIFDDGCAPGIVVVILPPRSVAQDGGPGRWSAADAGAC